MSRPAFLDQPYFRQRTPRALESMADYASPISHEPTERSWLAADRVIAAIAVAVLLALFLGLLP